MRGRSLLRGYTILLLALLYAPLVAVAVYSFNDSRFIGGWQGFTLRWYELIPSDPQLREAVYNSFLVAVLSAALGVALALPASLWSPDSRAGRLLVLPPIVIPEITEAVALMLLFIAIGFPMGALSVAIGHTTFNLAYAYMIIASTRRSTRELELAARTLGAPPHIVLARVTLPLLAPALAAALALAFMMSFTDFIKTVFTSGPGFTTLTILLWNRARRPGLNPYTSQSYLAAITTLLVAASLAAVLAYYIVSRRRGAQ